MSFAHHPYSVVAYKSNHPMITTGHWKRPEVLTPISLRLEYVSKHDCLQQENHPQDDLKTLTTLVLREVSFQKCGPKLSCEYSLVRNERPLHETPPVPVPDLNTAFLSTVYLQLDAGPHKHGKCLHYVTALAESCYGRWAAGYVLQSSATGPCQVWSLAACFFRNNLYFQG